MIVYDIFFETIHFKKGCHHIEYIEQTSLFYYIVPAMQ